MTAPSVESRPVRRIYGRLALGAALVGAIAWAAANREQLDPALVAEMVQDLGPWGPIGYVLLYAAATVLFLPGALFGLAGGALFGPVWGVVWNLLGATLGATLAFLAARHLAADWVARRAGGKVGQLIAGVEAEGWRFVALVRLVPLVPFNLLNYALGLTRIGLVPYAVASAVAMIPGVAAYTWLGHAGSEALAGEASALRGGLIGLGLLALVALAARLAQRWRRPVGAQAEPSWVEPDALAPRLGGSGVVLLDVRGPEEFDGPLGHLAGARNLPLDALSTRLGELAALKGAPVVLVCRSDKRSAKAAALLREAGFDDVAVLRGGMEAWNRRGLPVAS